MTAYPDPQLNDSDLELLSAYIDRQLTAADRATLEQRLEQEPALQLALDELRTTVGLLRELPPARPPRSFALDPQSVAPKRTWLFPWMQLGSALVAATLLIVFGFVLTRGIGGGASPASAPLAVSAPTSAPAAAAPTSAPAAPLSAAAEPTAAPAAEAPAAAGVAPTAVAAPTSAPAAALAPAATSAPPAAPEAALKTAQEPTEALPSSGGAASGAQPAAVATPAPAAPANDAASTPSTGTLRQAAGTPTPEPFTAQIATSGSSASDTQRLEQQPAPTPQASPGGRSSTILIGIVLLLIVLGGVLIWLFSRRKT